VKKHRWGEGERVHQADLLLHGKRRKIKSLGRQDVHEVLDGIVARGAPIMANRVQALLSKIYNFGIGPGIVEHHPCLGVPRPAKARQRDRVLSEDEIRSLWRVLDYEAPVMDATVKVRLMTAQRGVEALAMRWDHIGDWWTIPVKVAKNGLIHRVPLAPQVLALLYELRPVTGHCE